MLGRAFDLDNGNTWPRNYRNFFGTNHTGLKLSDNDLLSGTALFAAVRYIAEDIAANPHIVYERLDDGRRRHALDHPAYTLLHAMPNPDMTQAEFTEMLLGNLLFYWRAYVYIIRNKQGDPIELWPLHSPNMEIKIDKGRAKYLYHMGGKKTEIPRDQIMPVGGLRFTGPHGAGPFQRNQQSAAIGIAAERYAAEYYANGAHQSGVIEMPGKLKTKEDREYFKQMIRESYQGLGKSHNVMVLEEGSAFKPITADPGKSQLIEARKYSIPEVSRMLRIPPPMLMDLERATFSNIEHQQIQYVTHTLMPWARKLEQMVNAYLFTRRERSRYYMKIKLDGLLRGDSETRWKVYNQGITLGVLSRNEVRRWEDLDPVEGLDEHLVMVNMAPASQLESDQEKAAPKTTERELRALAGTDTRADDANKIARSRLAARRRFSGPIRQAIDRVVKRQARDIERQAAQLLGKRTREDFLEWLAEYGDKQPEAVQDIIGPTIQAYGETIAESMLADLDIETPGDMPAAIDTALDRVARDQVRSATNQLRDLVDKAESESAAREAIEQRMKEWRDTRADKLTDRTLHDVSEDLALFSMKRAGVTRIVWRTLGDSCPFCNQLDGRVVSIGTDFMSKGETIGDPDKPEAGIYSAPQNFKHPPIHRGCDCVVLPA